MMRRWLSSVLVAASVFAMGCEEEPPPTAEQEIESPPEQVAEAPEPTTEEVPVAEDFAAEAEAQIDDANYRAELEQIEADLEAE